MTELPESWKMCALEDLCAGKDAIVDGPFGSNLKRSDYGLSGIPVLKIQNIKENQIVIKKMDFVSEVKFRDLERHSYTDGDIVMTKLGDPLGISAIVSGVASGLIVADLVRIRPTSIDTRFLCYQLNSPFMQAFLNGQQKGTTRPRVNLSMVRGLPVSVPPLAEQHRIVEILEEQFSRLDAALASIRTVREKAAAFRISYLHDIFTNDSTGLLRLEPIALHKLLALSIGGIWGDEPGVGEVDVNVIRVTELKAFGKIEPSTASRRSVSHKQLLGRELLDGDLLLEKSGGGPKTPVGRVGLVDGTGAGCVCSNFMQLMRPDGDQIHSRYLFHFLNYFHLAGKTSVLQTSTTNIRNIKASEYLETPVPMGIVDDQRQIVAFVEAELSRLNSALIVCDQLESRIASQRRSLLHAAFAGALTAQWRETQLV